MWSFRGIYGNCGNGMEQGIQEKNIMRVQRSEPHFDKRSDGVSERR